MNYKKHFLKEHQNQAKREVSCIVDLCGRIALNTKKLNIDEANRFKKDLLNSLETITDLYQFKKDQDSWLKWKQIEGERNQSELIESLTLDDKQVSVRRDMFWELGLLITLSENQKK